MQISWRPNPKTPDGWPKRLAIALLAGLAVFILSSPIAFFLFLGHFETASPTDTQNLLSALSISVVVALGLALLTSLCAGLIMVLLGLYKPETAKRTV